MERLVIDRSRWLRGEGPMASLLYRPNDGKMCCIGFLALARGCTLEEIADRSAVDSSELTGLRPARLPNFPEKQFTTNELVKAYTLNDATWVTEAEREVRLKPVFAEMGYEVEFVDSVTEAS